MEEIYDLQREYNERRNGMEEIIVKMAEKCKSLRRCEENKNKEIMLCNSNSRIFWERVEKIIYKFL
jgi:hypothetical protein